MGAKIFRKQHVNDDNYDEDDADHDATTDQRIE